MSRLMISNLLDTISSSSVPELFTSDPSFFSSFDISKLD